GPQWPVLTGLPAWWPGPRDCTWRLGWRCCGQKIQVPGAMLAGWASQQLARNLSFGTAENRQRAVRAFAVHAGAFPWQWSAQLLDDWCTDLRAVRHLARSTVRNYTEAVRLFCSYLTDPAYGWAGECQLRFGTHPVQVCHEWNTAVHVQQGESGPSKRAFTVDELEAFFDYADGQVEAIRAAGRKGWWPAFRDATLFKAAYASGLRRNEVRMLDVADFGRNPEGQEFGEYGVCYVRFGKAMKGSPPKRRSVLTVWPWSAEILRQWAEDIRPLRAAGGQPGDVAVGAAAADRPGRDRRPVRRLPGRAGPGRRAGLPLAAKIVCDAPDRGRLGRPVRAAAGRA
ncbi:MAG: tyrosine-type recombinase/integrase, partial [Streptosporangiaceae bacterium]